MPTTPDSTRLVNFIKRLVAICGLLSLSACSTPGLNLFHRHKPLLKSDNKHPVVDVICLWQAAEGQGLDGLPTRGFAGQVLFFAHGYTEPVLVDGDVTIYVFDDHGSLDEQSKPLHVFQFSNEIWQRYSHETTLGASHQIFIPYTRLGPHQAECSIKVRYNGKNGSVTHSRMASIVLPGVKDQSKLTRIDAPHLESITPVSGTETASGVVQADFQPQRDTARIAPSETISGASSSQPAPDTSRLHQLMQQAVHEPAAEHTPTLGTVPNNNHEAPAAPTRLRMRRNADAPPAAATSPAASTQTESPTAPTH